MSERQTKRGTFGRAIGAVFGLAAGLAAGFMLIQFSIPFGPLAVAGGVLATAIGTLLSTLALSILGNSAQYWKNPFFDYSAGQIKRPKFTIQDLLLSTLLVGAGVGTGRLPSQMLDEFEIMIFGVPLWLTGGSLIGAGLLLPFGRAGLGAFFGFVATCVILNQS